MALTGTQRRIILKALYDKNVQVSEAGFILPSPQKFKDVADFWALNNPKFTQRDIEKTPVAYLIISRLKFEDEDPIEIGCEDNPLTYYDYQFRLFRQHFETRLDESTVPDDFLKRVNSSYELICDAVDGLKALYQGLQPVTGLPDGFEVNTNSLTQGDYSESIVPCEEIPGLSGFYTNLQCRIEVLIND